MTECQSASWQLPLQARWPKAPASRDLLLLDDDDDNRAMNVAWAPPSNSLSVFGESHYQPTANATHFKWDIGALIG